MPTRIHSLCRTSPKGQKFIGRCSQCGKEGVTLGEQLTEDCPNPLGITEDEALFEAVLGANNNPAEAGIQSE